MYTFKMFPSMTRGDNAGHTVIDILSLMSTTDDAHEAQKEKRSTKM